MNMFCIMFDPIVQLVTESLRDDLVNSLTT